MNLVLEALSLLRPFDIDIAKRRIGPNTDGGYVFADKISPSQAVLSYGISTEYRFDYEMAKGGHEVYMFDHTIDGINRINDKMRWFKQGASGITRNAENLYSVDDHLKMHNIEGNDLLLKMDIEGHEYDVLNAVPESIFSRFEQIVIEIHNLAHLNDEAFRNHFVSLFRKLNNQFTLFHVHANNYDGPDCFHIVGGVPVPNLLELSYVRTNAVNRRRSETLYPTVYDYPNTLQKDKLLWMFPFMPTAIENSEFLSNSERLDLIFKV